MPAFYGGHNLVSFLSRPKINLLSKMTLYSWIMTGAALYSESHLVVLLLFTPQIPQILQKWRYSLCFLPRTDFTYLLEPSHQNTFRDSRFGQWTIGFVLGFGILTFWPFRTEIKLAETQKPEYFQLKYYFDQKITFRRRRFGVLVQNLFRSFTASIPLDQVPKQPLRLLNQYRCGFWGIYRLLNFAGHLDDYVHRVSDKWSTVLSWYML